MKIEEENNKKIEGNYKKETPQKALKRTAKKRNLGVPYCRGNEGCGFQYLSA